MLIIIKRATNASNNPPPPHKIHKYLEELSSRTTEEVGQLLLEIDKNKYQVVTSKSDQLNTWSLSIKSKTQSIPKMTKPHSRLHFKKHTMHVTRRFRCPISPYKHSKYVYTCWTEDLSNTSQNAVITRSVLLLEAFSWQKIRRFWAPIYTQYTTGSRVFYGWKREDENNSKNIDFRLDWGCFDSSRNID